MSRPIKFRAWDIYKKVFIPTDKWAVVQTSFNAFGMMLEDWENYRGGEFFYSNTQILMQFTGLHDRNGREIYEGDVVQHPAWDYPFFIVFDAERARFVCKMRTGLSQYIANREIEVIGNIYENPELIKQEGGEG